MHQGSATIGNTADREIIGTRVYDAPRELVWRMWTEAEHIAKWWGPNGFTNTIHEMEVKHGGVWRFIMHGPDGTDYPNEIHYTEVVKPELLKYDQNGKEGEPGYHGVTVTFEAIGEKTKVCMRMVFNTAEERDMIEEKYHAVEGLYQNLNKLHVYLLELPDAG